jgi:ATP-dependent Clp protease ATP-binding subunit ClpA
LSEWLEPGASPDERLAMDLAARRSLGKAAPRDRRARRRLDPTRAGWDAGGLESSLRLRIVGQDEAISQIVNVYQTYLTGMHAPYRPVANLLFLGPTGSGKTRTVEAVAETLLGTPRAAIKIDCAEFQHSHEIAKLIGSPPGYLGHRETHPLLSQETLNQHHTSQVKLSFVLFDEIEKASDALWNLLLGILDKATLTLGDNRKVDFSNCLIFMTSNLGAARMNAVLRPGLGFGAAAPAAAGTDEAAARKIERTAVDAARRKFTPEFMNRIDKIVVFKPLGEAELSRVLDIEIGAIQQRIFDAPPGGFLLRLTASARRHLLQEGTDLKYGARHLKRALERLVVQPLSNLMATRQVEAGDLVAVDCDEASGSLVFSCEDEDLSLEAMAGMAGPFASIRPKTAAAQAAEPAKAPVSKRRN